MSQLKIKVTVPGNSISVEMFNTINEIIISITERHNQPKNESSKPKTWIWKCTGKEVETLTRFFFEEVVETFLPHFGRLLQVATVNVWDVNQFYTGHARAGTWQNQQMTTTALIFNALYYFYFRSLLSHDNLCNIYSLDFTHTGTFWQQMILIIRVTNPILGRPCSFHIL